MMSMNVQAKLERRRRFQLSATLATLLAPFADMDDRVLQQNRLRAQARNKRDSDLFDDAGEAAETPVLTRGGDWR
jgi:hypothetical protein